MTRWELVKIAGERLARWLISRGLPLAHLDVLKPGGALRVIRRMLLIAIGASKKFVAVRPTVDVAGVCAMISAAFDAFRCE